jgi:PKD repeat protein
MKFSKIKISINQMLMASAGVMIAFAQCSPDKNDGELGALPKPEFDIVQTQGSNTVKFINKTQGPSVAFWTFSNGVKSKGDTASVNFTFAGTYTGTLLTEGHGGIDSVKKTVTISQNDPTACQDPNNPQAFLAGCTKKTWRLMPTGYAEMVGPNPGDGSWWGNPAGEVSTLRSCEWNDEYTFNFNAQGLYQFDNKGDFYDDGYMGNANYSCGTNNQLSGQQQFWATNLTGFSYVVTPAANGQRAKLTLIGKGAHIAMAKVQNGGEFPAGPVNNSVTYDILSMSHDPAGFDKLVLTIQAASGVWWTFTLRTY